LKRSVTIGAGAEVEMAEASRWYDEQRLGLGLDFLRAIERTLVGIEAVPRTGSLVPGVADTEIRRVRVRRFPYHVIYLELPDRVQVLAIAHHRRHPRYWIGRVRQ